ncbi:MAG: type II toxin-antitoxin system Phd/YefM family antitoxin [Gammaproteobacteria bacterium]|nr:type II toxin-antitoxin system Phd/YefM family antitoxin [Gammaproteobacteria bacterium]
MKQVNIHEAKTQLSKLVDLVANGEEIVIAKAGKPAARLVPLQQDQAPRMSGLLRGKIRWTDDFDDPLPDEILAAFEGRKQE